MFWIVIAMIVIGGFALLKVRRQRKARQAVSSYSESKAA